MSAGRKFYIYYGIYIGLIIFSFILVLIPTINNKVNVYDEGNILYGSTMVSHGAVPYRDFWTIYSPGQYYSIGALYRIFGASVYAERLWDFFIKIMVALAAFMILRRLTAKVYATALVFIIVLWFGRWDQFGYPSMPAILFFMCSIICSLDYMSSEKKRFVFFSGIFVGLTAIFRQDFGIYALVVQLFMVLSLVGSPARVRYGNVALLAVGTLCVVIFPTIYFFHNVPFKELIFNLIIYPIFVQPPYRHLNYPKLSMGNFHFYFPFIIYATAAVMIISDLRRTGLSDKEKQSALTASALVASGVFFFAQLRNRPDMAHLQGFLIFAFILQGYVLLRIGEFSGLKRLWSAAVIVILTAIVIAYPLSKEFKYYFHKSANGVDLMARAGGPALEANLAAATDYIRLVTGPEEKIFVGNSRHDRIFINNVAFYYYAKRRSAVKYACFDPGVIDTPAIQKEIVEDIKFKKVKYIVLWSGMDDVSEPNKSSVSSGCFVLDDFIKKNYFKKKVFGKYTILKKI